MTLSYDIEHWADTARPDGRQMRDHILQWGPLRSVVECAGDLGVISPPAREDLVAWIPTVDPTRGTRPDYRGRSFASFVGPDDPWLDVRDDIGNIPPGAFMACIEVDPPADGRDVGRRHLVHPMISLGGGHAMGVGHEVLFGQPPGDTWDKLALRDLHWVPANAPNRWDLVDIAASATGRARRVRIRYRDHGSGAVVSPHQWGQPANPDELAERAARDILASIRGYRIASCRAMLAESPSRQWYRIEAVARLEPPLFREFFNSPDGMRGHFYSSVADGEAFLQSVMDRVAPNIPLNAIHLDLDGASTMGSMTNFFESLRHALVWPIEPARDPRTNQLPPRRERPMWMDPWTDLQRQVYPPNDRWSLDRQRTIDNLNGMILEHWNLLHPANPLDALPAEGTTERRAIASQYGLVTHYLVQSENARFGAQFWQCNPDFKGPNVLINGKWWDAEDGSLHDFDLGRKKGWKYQLKWAGFS